RHLTVSVLSILTLCLYACTSTAALPDLAKLPPAAVRQIDFSKDIQPLLEGSCLKCHGPEKHKSGLPLDTHENALAGGEHGQDIVPGDSAKSPLIHYVARLVEDMEMPPKDKGEPLTPAQIGLLRAWIDQGASWSREVEAGEKLMDKN